MANFVYLSTYNAYTVNTQFTQVNDDIQNAIYPSLIYNEQKIKNVFIIHSNNNNVHHALSKVHITHTQFHGVI